MTDSQSPPKSKVLGPEVGYVDLLDHHTAAKQKEASTVHSYFPLRPSSAGKCTKELAYELLEHAGKATYEKDLREPNEQRLLDLGHSIEYHINQQFNSVPWFKSTYKQQVVKVFDVHTPKGPVMIEGSMDTCFISEEWKCVVDFKSKKDKYSNYYANAWDETSKKLEHMSSVQKLTEMCFWVEDLDSFLTELKDPFFESNFLQLNLYANSDFCKERGIDHAAIIQYNKNDSRIREIRFKPSLTAQIKTRQKFQEAITVLSGEATPESVNLIKRDYHLGSIKCAFCSFKKHCWQGDDSLKAYFQTFPKKDWPTDIERVDKQSANTLRELFLQYTENKTVESTIATLEQEIIKLLQSKNIHKIRLDKDNVYEVKFYKSPSERFALKRSK